jgi:hypothetical protein
MLHPAFDPVNRKTVIHETLRHLIPLVVWAAPPE